MSEIFDMWHRDPDVSGLQQEARRTAASAPSGSFSDPGEYFVNIENLSITKSKAGKPMLLTIFEIAEGPHKGEKIRFYQLLQQGWQLDSVCRFLLSLNLVEPEDCTYLGQIQFAKLVEICREEAQNCIFAILYEKTGKGFPKITVRETYDK